MSQETLNLVLAVTLIFGLICIPMYELGTRNINAITCDEIAQGPMSGLINHSYIQYKCGLSITKE